MGTSGSYRGGGGAAGRRLRDQVSSWLDSIDDQNPDLDVPSDVDSPANRPEAVPQLSPKALLPAVELFPSDRPRIRRPHGSVDGPGSGGGGAVRGGQTRVRGGGAKRSLSASARTAGRAASAAWALRTGNAELLADLGLNFFELRGLSLLDQISHIVEAACGPISNGTIEDDERRIVAAEVAEWVLVQGGVEPNLDLDEVLKETLARIIFEAVSTETGDLIRNGNHPDAISMEIDRQLRDAARVLVDRADLTPGAPTPDEITRAIEDGINRLRRIRG